MNKQNSDSVVLSPGKTANSFLAADGTTVKLPKDWVWLLPGDAALTRRVKKGSVHWIIEECQSGKKQGRIFSRGICAPSLVVEQIRDELAVERDSPSYQKKQVAAKLRRDKVQEVYVEDFSAAVVEFLNFDARFQKIAALLGDQIAAHATPIGSGTVARTKRIPVSQRAEAAVIAWLRHQTTGYDSMVIPRVKGKRREVRRMLAERSRQMLEKYRRGLAVDAGCPLQTALNSLTSK